MKEWRKSLGWGLTGGRRLLAPALTGAVAFLLFSAAPAAADSKQAGEVKDPVARSMVDAADYLCRKKCAQEHKRPMGPGEKENPEYLECLKKCGDENPLEITGTYALDGTRSSGDCPGFSPAVTDPAVPVEEGGGKVTFFSRAEISAPLGADGSFRGEGTYLSGDGTVREIIEGKFAKDATGRAVFIGTRTFEDLAGGCSVAYRVIYTRQQGK